MRKSRIQPVALKADAATKLQGYEFVESYIQPGERARH